MRSPRTLLSSCPHLIECDTTPPGFPLVHDFLPDIGGFCPGWLGREVPWLPLISPGSRIFKTTPEGRDPGRLGLQYYIPPV